MDENYAYGLIPKQHPACPNCLEKERIIPILYGLPNLDAIQLEREGRLELGSRFYQAGSPCWRCTRCGLQFGSA
jgi:hypothetical protein